MNKVKDMEKVLLLEYSNLIQKRNYCPYLSRMFDGNILCAVLLQRMLYNYQRSSGKYGDRFYKFQGPNKHSMYKVGDSWIEELGTTRHRFVKAYSAIGQVAHSEEEKDEMLKSRARNHAIVSLKGADNVTWFYINRPVVIALLEEAQRLHAEEEKRRVEQEELRVYQKARIEVLEDLCAEGVISSAQMENGCAETENGSPKPGISNNTINSIIISLPEYQSEDLEDVKVKTFASFSAETKKEEKKKRERKPKKELTEEQKAFLARRRDIASGKVMEDNFEISPETIELALQMGYNGDSIRDEARKFTNYYKNGKGAVGKSSNWNTKFVDDWLDRGFKNGYLKRNGTVFNQKETRSEQLRRVASANDYSDLD